MDDLALKKHRLLLDLLALEAELSRVIILNEEPPFTPKNSAIFKTCSRRTNSAKA
jgi:hypothetical protein